MNPASLKEAESLFGFFKKEAKNIKDVEIVICPPFAYLESLAKILSAKPRISNFKLGAQDCFWENQGAYTGEISPLMLKNLGAEYAIVGHSERRNYLGETDAMIAKKIKSVFENGLIPALCVGETLEQKKKGLAREIIKNQIQEDLKEIKNLNLKIENLIIAYEPVWAIGTGNDCQPKDALEIIKHIKQILDSESCILNYRVVYGGSIDPGDVAGYLQYPEIEGALVGGASLKMEEFKKIINEVPKPGKTEPAQK